MARIPEMRFDSWRDFKRDLLVSLFPDERHRYGTYLFRGMRSPQWRLEPTFDREFRHLEAADRPRVFDRLLASFTEECRAYGVPAEVCDDPKRLIALGQHHGLPTRLLDWTTSPYIAAYFAYESTVTGTSEDSHVVVWILHLRSPVWKSSDVDFISAPSHYNERARNQFGCFTLSRGPHECLEDLVTDDGTEPALTRVLLPVDEARLAIRDLELMGINALRVFPDLAGVASACTMRFRLESDQRSQTS